MSNAYTADGRRRSSMTHASVGHKCDLCGRVAFGNGGNVSHGRGHVNRGEAIELVKFNPEGTPTRTFLSPQNTELLLYFKDHGFDEVPAQNRAAE